MCDYRFHLSFDIIAGFQSIPGDLKYKDTAAMMVEQTREANEGCFVIGNQHGLHDVT